MDVTDQIARLYNTSPFDVLERDAEHVIMVVNYVLEKYSDTAKNGSTSVTPVKKQKDSFWDF